MKFIKICVVIIVILILTACSSQSKIDISRYVKIINSSGTVNLTLDDFSLTSSDDEYIYKAMVDKNILLCAYCKSDGVIEQITVTCKNQNEKFDELSIRSISAITDSTNAKELFNKAVSLGSTSFSEYKITFVEYNIGKTIIINYSDAKINTNNNPTLKGYIDEDDISRPTLS